MPKLIYHRAAAYMGDSVVLLRKTADAMMLNESPEDPKETSSCVMN